MVAVRLGWVLFRVIAWVFMYYGTHAILIKGLAFIREKLRNGCPWTRRRTPLDQAAQTLCQKFEETLDNDQVTDRRILEICGNYLTRLRCHQRSWKVLETQVRPSLSLLGYLLVLWKWLGWCRWHNDGCRTETGKEVNVDDVMLMQMTLLQNDICAFLKLSRDLNTCGEKIDMKSVQEYGQKLIPALESFVSELHNQLLALEKELRYRG